MITSFPIDEIVPQADHSRPLFDLNLDDIAHIATPMLVAGHDYPSPLVAEFFAVSLVSDHGRLPAKVGRDFAGGEDDQITVAPDDVYGMAKFRSLDLVIDATRLPEQRPEQHPGISRLLDPAACLKRDL